ncbi:MAG TPA: MFS transporter [Actinospica sp.]|nr:MFS transporter [Actinospica sp.]
MPRLLVPAAFVTALGNNVQLIAGALLVLRADRTMLSVGWLFIAVAAPQVLLSPVFGRLADRLDRRRLWVGSDLAGALVALALPLWLWHGGAAGPGIYAANLALAVLSALFFPASAALIKERVPAERLRRFTANYEMATQAGMFLSATVGGLCVQTFGAIPLLLGNAGTFVVSALCVLAVGRAPAPAHAVPVEDVAAAPQPRPRLGWQIVLFAQGSVVVTIFNALLPKLVIGEFHRGAGVYGAADALGSLGFLGATWSYRVLAPRLGDLRISLVGYLACSVLFAAQPNLGVAGLLPLVLLSAFMFGHARMASRNLLMSSVDPRYTGRVFGTANGGGLAATIAAMLVVAELTDHTDCAYGFAATALLSGAAVAACAVRLTGARFGAGQRAATPVRSC